MITSLKWWKRFATVVLLIGAALVASKTAWTPYGFLFFLVGSSTWMVVSWIMKEPELFVVNLVFIFIDIMGIYNWIVSA